MRTQRLPKNCYRAIYDQCYETIPIQNCIYCGEEWEVLDHVPPIAGFQRRHWAFKYPACRDCNAILSAAPFIDIRKRRYLVLMRLFRRYKKIIKMPHWEKIEINELKGMVRSFVKGSSRMQRVLLRRIDFLSENYVAPTELK